MATGKCIAAAVMMFSLPALGGPLPPGKWLVDLGRDYPLSPQASLTDADAQITLLFMQAASRIDPQLAEAHLWQYHMLSALGRAEDARRSLAQYVRLWPSDISAQLNLLELKLGALQTAEERADLCRQQLARRDAPRELVSDLHRRLAEHHYNRGEMAEAAAAASEALKADNANLAARALLTETRRTASPHERPVRALLDFLAMSPGSVAASRELADRLVALGMAAEADRWYQHAAAVAALMPPGTAPPDLLAARAAAMIDAGRLPEADKLAQAALQVDAKSAEAHLVLARMAGKGGQEEAARRHVAQVAGVWKDLLARPPGSLDPAAVAEAAWFFAHYDPQPAEAEKLARAALQDRADSVVARRALGDALRQSGRLEEAQDVLATAADRDAWAGIALAQTLRAAGREQHAADRLRTTSTRPADGEQRDLIQRLMSEWQVPPANDPPAFDGIRQMLTEFPSAVLAYPAEPGKFLSLTLSMPRDELPPGEPWRCAVKLRNTGPFPITFGRNMMVDPDLICAIETRGDQPRSSGPTIRILLDVPPRLMPGQSFTVTQTIDIGPIRASMIGTPQVSHEVDVAAVLSPVRLLSAQGEETWAPGVGGLLAPSLHFRRAAFLSNTARTRALIQQSRSAEVDVRIAATELLAMLLGEHQHLTARRLRYAAPRIDTAMVQDAILARAKDPAWQVRARLAECMRWFLLDRQCTPIARTHLPADEHWLVRGLALRMLADHLGPAARPDLQRHAETDPDEWVRLLAQALLLRLDLTTQPAGAQEIPR